MPHFSIDDKNMSGMQHPSFIYFLQEFAIIRRFAPIYLIVAAILLFAARPGLAAISIAGVSGIVCGALQLLAAYFGAKRLYKTIYLIMVFELVGFIYFRIGPFDATIFQNSALMLLAVALQRTVCAYLHRFVFGGVSASAEE